MILERAQGEAGKLAKQRLEASDRSPWSPLGCQDATVGRGELGEQFRTDEPSEEVPSH